MLRTTVTVVDATNRSVSLTVDAAGNFYRTSAFKFPLTVTVSSGGKQRSMTTSITSAMSGDCNGCHTQNGTGTPRAPGRILQPH